MKESPPVELIKINGKPYTVGYGKFCFPIFEGKVIHCESSKVGCELKGPKSVKEYTDAYEMAQLAWDEQIFDKIIEQK